MAVVDHLAQPPIPLSSWAPVILGGSHLAASREGQWLHIFRHDGPEVLVALASTTPAHAELAFDVHDGASLVEVVRESGTGAQVVYAASPLQQAAALGARVDGAGPGWLSFHAEMLHAQPDGAGAFLTVADESARACEAAAHGFAPSSQRATKLHLARDVFDTARGQGALALGMAQWPADASVAVTFIPRPREPLLRFETDGATSYQELGEVDTYVLYDEQASCFG
jgi:hypothetical protein